MHGGTTWRVTNRSVERGRPSSIARDLTGTASNYILKHFIQHQFENKSMSKADYLLTIGSVRERTRLVLDKALDNKLNHFDVDMSKLGDVVEYTLATIREVYGHNYDSIPPHGRWQHFDVGGIERVQGLVESWNGVPEVEIARRLVDLFVVSVLLDAGAGKVWKFTEPSTGAVYGRSEGLAVASLYMFTSGAFSSSESNAFQVDKGGLASFDADKLKSGFQVSESNPLAGADGRAGLIANLGRALDNTKYFGETGRPGNLVDYLQAESQNGLVDLAVLWDALMIGLGPVWPAGRTKLDGRSLGDAWPCDAMPQDGEPWERIVPFHKLTQWLCYSILTPMKKYAGLRFADENAMTGLPEYRNGGLLVDLGLLVLKPKDRSEGLARAGKDATIPLFSTDDDVIVEWRACTVGFLDKILEKVNAVLPAPLTLPQLLEAGTWASGRRIAVEKRPDTKGPPIDIISDGTVF